MGPGPALHLGGQRKCLCGLLLTAEHHTPVQGFLVLNSCSGTAHQFGEHPLCEGEGKYVFPRALFDNIFKDWLAIC